MQKAGAEGPDAPMVNHKELMMGYLNEKVKEVFLAKGEYKEGTWVEDGIKKELKD
jgi:hypothetical protein